MGKIEQNLFSEKTARLAGWLPASWDVSPSWRPIADQFFASESGLALGRFIRARLEAGAEIYPPQPLRALALTPLDKVSVVILGQDPYHGPGQAEGLSFSVPAGVKTPPSLRNIRKELTRNLGVSPQESGSLSHWAEQGVLLLNTCLTVEKDSPASHSGKGWEALTDEIIHILWNGSIPTVFMLWGAHAQGKQDRLMISGADGGATGRHLVLCANHPSPLSAMRPPRPFLGCGHFGQANEFLGKQGRQPINW